MDADTMKRKDDYRKVLGDFRAGKTDILVGTQMIAKGLHFPNVTLVGIIYADLALHQPDFRAGERTFQLLTQVAGRAGRGDVEGEVFVQAFAPFHPAIQYARRHDFNGFYEQEIEFREQLKYPPVSRVALLTLKGRNEEKVKFSAEHLKKVLGGPQVQSPKSKTFGELQERAKRGLSDMWTLAFGLDHCRASAGAVVARGNFLPLPDHAADARDERVEPRTRAHHPIAGAARRRHAGRGH